MYRKQDYIARQPYIKMIRQMSSVEQKDVEQERNLYLFADKIVSAHREFQLKDVFDISFKSIKEEGGILYLHTNHAVYAYTVKHSPTNFIQTCKWYIKNNKAT